MADDIDKLFKRATEHMGKRRFDKAAEAYTQLCQVAPNNTAYRQRLAEAQRLAGQTREAAATYQLVADRYARAGELLKAIAVNKLILELEPSHKATQAKLAKLYAQRTAGPAPEAPGPAPKQGATVADDDLDALFAEATVKATTPQESDGTSPEEPAPGGAASPAKLHLPRTPIFSDLDPTSFAELLERCTLREFPPNTSVINQGDPGESFYVISSGSVRVSRTGSKGERIALARLLEGAFFGEMALLGNSPRTASVVTEGETVLLEFPALVLKQLMAEYPTVWEAVDKFIRNRLLVTVMASSPLFRPFSPDERRHIIDKFEEEEVAAGQTVLAEGTPGEALYVAMKGRYRIQRRGAGGQPELLAELHEGDLFGEISLLTESDATADVVAVEAGRVLKLPRAAFDELVAMHPQIRQLAVRIARERTLRLEAPPPERAPDGSQFLM